MIIELASWLKSRKLAPLKAAPRMRPPAWPAREAMLADGIVDEGVVHRWETALDRLDSAPARPTIFAAQFTAIGRRER